jgi:membrane-bound lytic murein transglycosylase D
MHVILIFFALILASPASALSILPFPYVIERYHDDGPLGGTDDIEKAVPSEQLDSQVAATTPEPPVNASNKGRVRQIEPFGRQPQALGYEAGQTFRITPEIKSRVQYWIDVYTKYSSHQAVIHDTLHQEIIYAVVDLSDIHANRRLSWRQRVRREHRRTDRVKARYRRILRNLHHKRNRPSSMNTEERRVYDMFRPYIGGRKFLLAAGRGRIRAQGGQRDSFLRGMFRAGQYLEHMEKIFREHNLPVELTRLPFVESSFNVKAISKVGASGIWQFMPSTGKQYMSINSVVDERNDPLRATVAAAKLLRRNFDYLGTWPLALTAYNHGLAGLERAVALLGTRKIEHIIRYYTSRTFGFASANFYATFLAALHVERNYKKYFGDVIVDHLLDVDEIQFDRYVTAPTFASVVGVNWRTLRDLNPGLRRSIWNGSKYIPANYSLRIPKGTRAKTKAAFANLGGKQKFRRQRVSRFHMVRRGDTLGQIARRYRVSLAALRRVNGLTRTNIIRVGRRLVIPGRR